MILLADLAKVSTMVVAFPLDCAYVYGFLYTSQCVHSG
jgi:hypothetical protein